MEVNGSGALEAQNPLNRIQSTTEPSGSVRQPSSILPQDEVVISPVAKLLDDLNQTSQIRFEQLVQIKDAIEAGVYESPERIEIALERLLQEIHVDE